MPKGREYTTLLPNRRNPIDFYSAVRLQEVSPWIPRTIADRIAESSKTIRYELEAVGC